MIFRDVTLDCFIAETEQKSIICVGAGKLLDLLIFSQENCFVNQITLIADNNVVERTKKVLNREITIVPVNLLREIDLKDKIILITSLYCRSLYEQLTDLLEGYDNFCYIYPLMSLRTSNHESIKQKQNAVIPKTIHYFWFGKKPIPDKNLKCIESWKRFCPDFDIIKWTENEYDINNCRYMKQAYDAGKMGFVPDYARLDVLHQYGGVYLDTDVEIIKPIDDLLSLGCYMGFQRDFLVNLGLGFGCNKDAEIVAEMKELYEHIEFGSGENLHLTASPYYQSLVLKEHGLVFNNVTQTVDGVTVLSTDYLDPMGYSYGTLNITENTHSIHHYDESWVDKDARNENLNKYSELDYFRKSRLGGVLK